ncbi:hypothetical protein [Methylobacterium sp. JK268]
MLPFSLATSLSVPPETSGRNPAAWQSLDIDGTLAPLRGRLPRAIGRFAKAPGAARGRTRVPHGAIVSLAPTPIPPRPANRVSSPAPRRLRIPFIALIGIATGGAQRDAVRPPHPPRQAPPKPARRGMPRRHKLMLALAAEVLLAGSARARQTFREPAVLIEDPGRPDRKIAVRAAPIPTLPARC